MRKRKAVFLDRDGTINAEVNFLARPEDVRLLPGVAQGLRLLKSSGFMLVVVSNQSGLARGIFSEADLCLVQLELKRQLAAEGAAWDGVYFCPHHPSEGVVADYVQDCDCRKPKPGLVLMAAKEMSIELNGSYMVGDRKRDVLCGKAAGLTSILVESGRHHEDGAPTAWEAAPDFIARDFMSATHWILTHASRDAAELE